MKVKVNLMWLVIILMGCAIKVNAQVIDSRKCKEFLEAKDLYLIKSLQTMQEFRLSNDSVVSFEKLVRDIWKEKNVIVIEEEAFNNLEDVKNLYFISLQTYSLLKVKKSSGVIVNETDYGILEGILVKKGKHENPPKNMVYWYQTNVNQIFEKDILPERLIYDLKNLKYLIESYDDESKRTTYTYKNQYIDEYLSKNTLVLRKSFLDKKFSSPEKIKKVYPYSFKIVSDEEWADVIRKQEPGMLFFDFIMGGHYTGSHLYCTDDMKILFNAYPWIGFFSVKKKLIKKML